MTCDEKDIGDVIPSMSFKALWAAAQTAVTRETKPVHPDDVLYYCYTGGTTSASRCVKITHRMALHELKTYPAVAKLGTNDRVLQQHSVYPVSVLATCFATCIKQCLPTGSQAACVRVGKSHSNVNERQPVAGLQNSELQFPSPPPPPRSCHSSSNILTLGPCTEGPI